MVAYVACAMHEYALATALCKIRITTLRGNPDRRAICIHDTADIWESHVFDQHAVFFSTAVKIAGRYSLCARAEVFRGAPSFRSQVSDPKCW